MASNFNRTAARMIGKGRHSHSTPGAHDDAPSRPAFRNGCGVLRHHATPGSYQHLRYPPSSALADWVQHFWIESWDVRGHDAQVREVLPHPNVQCVFAHGRSKIYGVQLRRFVRQLTGADRIFGITFRAGAFYPFLREPMCSIADASIPVQSIFPDAPEAEAKILACRNDQAMVRAASRFLRAHLPPRDSRVEAANAVVRQIVSDPTITRVGHLVPRSGFPQRTLQRLFTRYVGASAQWIIKRYRIYDALEMLDGRKPFDWAALAQDLGYFDQAHFINDFKKLIGCAPAVYARRLSSRPAIESSSTINVVAGVRMSSRGLVERKR